MAQQHPPRSQNDIHRPVASGGADDVSSGSSDTSAKPVKHRLDPLLRPRSIAVVGASERRGTVGQQLLSNLLAGQYSGTLLCVNPGYQEVQGQPCYPSIADCPEAPEHVMFAVADERLENALDQAIEAKTKAVTIYSALILDDEVLVPNQRGMQQDRASDALSNVQSSGTSNETNNGPNNGLSNRSIDQAQNTLRQRIAQKLKQADILVCGANAMGFFNFEDGVWACGFDTRHHERGGNVALISQSGSGMCGIVDCENRIDFNMAVSSGHELTVGLEDYLDYAIEQSSTDVIGLFIETCRQPERLRAAFKKAQQKNIPIVAIKTGRTEKSAALTVSHSGALAGNDAAFDAVFERYGVQRVADMDELTTALILFSQMQNIGAGGLVTLHDSGGERQLLIDLADKLDVELAELNPATVDRLSELLDPGLLPVNPLDGWSRGGPHADKNMIDLFTTLIIDDNAALGAVIHDRAPDGAIYPEYINYLKQAHAASNKPVALVASRQGPGSDPLVVSVTKELGMPILDDVSNFLIGVRCLFGFRDEVMHEDDCSIAFAQTVIDRWRRRVDQATPLNEAEAFELLRDFEINCSPAKIVDNIGACLDAWRQFQQPVVLKTAQINLAHKSDQQGVVLGLNDAGSIGKAFQDLSSRFNSPVTIAPMADAGVELILGMHRDPDFGPLIVLGFGGIHAEILNDVGVALPPFEPVHAQKMLDRLHLRAMLDGPRGLPASDIESVCQLAARFSQMVIALEQELECIDLNPVVVHQQGYTVVDAHIVARSAGIEDLNPDILINQARVDE